MSWGDQITSGQLLTPVHAPPRCPTDHLCWDFVTVVSLPLTTSKPATGLGVRRYGVGALTPQPPKYSVLMTFFPVMSFSGSHLDALPLRCVVKCVLHHLCKWFEGLGHNPFWWWFKIGHVLFALVGLWSIFQHTNPQISITEHQLWLGLAQRGQILIVDFVFLLFSSATLRPKLPFTTYFII